MVSSPLVVRSGSFVIFNGYLRLIHHLYPTGPFDRYGACFREIRADLAARGARVVEPSLLRPRAAR